MLEEDDAVDAPDENLLETQNAGKIGSNYNFVSIIRFIMRCQFLVIITAVTIWSVCITCSQITQIGHSLKS